MLTFFAKGNNYTGIGYSAFIFSLFKCTFNKLLRVMILEKIFFSYSRSDGSDFALRLALDLKKEGFNVWIDQEDIRAGSEWDLEIEKALETCDCLLFIETEKSVSSNNVLDEVYYALGQNKKVIPLVVHDSKTPFRLQRLQHISFTKDYNSGLTLLTNELKGNTVPEAFLPGEGKPLIKADQPFYKKYSRLLLIIISLVVIIVAALIYKLNNNKTIPAENNRIVNSNDTINHDNKSADIEPKEPSQKDAITTEGQNEKTAKAESSNKKANETANETVHKQANKTENLNETFAGDWALADVDPKAESKNGYLKIEAIDEKKVAIKSYVQFYYFKTNDTSFLSIFNAFTGCSSCILEKDMKIKAEDIAISSQAYKILKHDQPGGGKAGDTVMNSASNKSIHASVTLHLLNNTTAVIKVEQSAAIELSHGLLLKPFIYSFRFTKTDE